MKAILISVRPEWVEKILNGEKTIEIRKTIPKGCWRKKFEPIEVYIYCTERKVTHRTPKFVGYAGSCDAGGFQHQEGEYVNRHLLLRRKRDKSLYWHSRALCEDDVMNGKIVAKFTLKRTYDIGRIPEYWTDKDQFNSGVEKYSCLNQKQLIEYAGMKADGYPARLYIWFISNLETFAKPKPLSDFGLERPPQSWRYIEV
jgi:predicted transcriptional regulator